MELQTVVAILPPTLARPTKSRRLLKGRHAASFHTSVKPLLINVGFSLLSTKKKLKISVENMNDLKQVFENPKQEKKLIQKNSGTGLWVIRNYALMSMATELFV